jgi:glucans biosynthesis protein C
MKTSTERHYDLDWLRLLAILILIYFHTAAIFYQGSLGEFYVTNSVHSPVLEICILFVYQWHMPLLFFLAGTATWLSLQVRTTRKYVRERLQRLFIPFLFGTLILVPPQVYCHLLQTSDNQASYIQFYPQFFNGIRPAGNCEWGHLWFLIYLLVFSLITLPLFLRLKQVIESTFWTKLLAKFSRDEIIFYAALPLAVIEAFLRPRWIGFQNLYDDWANVLLYLIYYCYGYLIYSGSRLGQMIDRQHVLLLRVAIVCMSILLQLWITDTVPDRGYSLAYMVYQAFRGFNSWCWVIALVGLTRSHLNFNNDLLKYASEASYPIYMMHQTFVVAIGFYVVQWNLNIPQKFIIISTGTMVCTLFLYNFVIRKIGAIRFCFGLKLLLRQLNKRHNEYIGTRRFVWINPMPDTSR